MLSISLSSLIPQNQASPKSNLFSNYRLCRDVRGIAHSNNHFALVCRASSSGDDVASGDWLPAPVVSHERMKLSWWPLNGSFQGNSEKNPHQEKKCHVSDSSQADFLRFKRGFADVDIAGELQASVVSYRKKLPWRFLNPGFQVDLVSAVHIAEKQYFETLQQRLGNYDCVLYEGVGSRDKDINIENDDDDDDDDDSSNMKGYNITGLAQRFIGRVLSLDFQLDCINYKGQNWYNADLDLETFEQLQEERGETLIKFARDAVGQALKSELGSNTEQNGQGFWRSTLLRVSWVLPMPLSISLLIQLTCSPPDKNDTHLQVAHDYAVVEEFFELGFSTSLKVFLAKALTSEFAGDFSEELERDSVIIGERNRAAIEELRSAISRGKKKIAIFYGAGHMPDLGRRLKQELNLVPTQVDWITAWSMKKPERKLIGPFFEKYMGKYLPAVTVISCVLLLDLWLWWAFLGSAVNWAYWAGLQMVRLVGGFVIR